MIQLKKWQWFVLATPFISIVLFFLIAAGIQIQQWGVSWIWGIVVLIFLGWRLLLVRWTKPVSNQIETLTKQVNEELEATPLDTTNQDETIKKNIELALQSILQEADNDPPIWEDWQLFWKRCQDVVSAVAHSYYPEVKYPLLNIYIPQFYGLIRGTVDDVDRWMQQLSPALNQVTVGQAYRAYEMYQQVQPSAQKVIKVWSWAQWVINPAVALAKQVSQGYNEQANQALLGNLSQVLRQAALRQLANRSIALYSGKQPTSEPKIESFQAAFPKAQTQTIQAILEEAQPQAEVKEKPVNLLLIGRTGAGKSSVINTLFQSQQATVDVLPNTDRIESYHWESVTGEILNLWDSPGYEQVRGEGLRELVLEYATTADVLLLVTPAIDPALDMDQQFLSEIQTEISDLPTIAVVTQVDKLRPVREWNPPYDWEHGIQPKEKSIREATSYRKEQLSQWCGEVFPLVTWDRHSQREGWNTAQLSLALLNCITPAKQERLGRFLRDREARSVAAAKIIDRYTRQMTTTQGVTALLKNPILEYISTFSTGSPALGKLLLEQIPVEDIPLVIGKLQMAYELFNLFNSDQQLYEFDLRSIWSLLLDHSESPEKNAFAFGHALIAYWTKGLTLNQLRETFKENL